jgi:hypothetical protein
MCLVGSLPKRTFLHSRSIKSNWIEGVMESRFGRFTRLELVFLLLNPAWGLLLLAGLPRILCI